MQPEPSSRPQHGQQPTYQIDETELRINQDGNATVIPVDSIIAVGPAAPGPSDHDSILYTVENTAAEDGAEESPLLFQSLPAKGLPQDVIKSLGASAHNDWLPRLDSQEQPVERHVVVSIKSGTGLAFAVWQSLVKPLLDHIGLRERQDYHIHLTTSETSVTASIRNIILPKANDGVAQSILLLSGDGGIVDVVNTLLSGDRAAKYKKPIVSLLPLGTGNALANSSGITDDKTLGLSTMLRGSPKEIPLFRATFSPGARLVVNQGQDEQRLHGTYDDKPAAYGAVVCSWGLHATLVADSDTVEYRQFGVERFKMAGKEALYPSDGSLPHAYLGTVSIRRPGSTEWETLPRKEHGYVLATLVSQLEAGFTISPASTPLDGKLRLVDFGQLSGEAAMEVMTKAYQGGKHVDDDRVEYREIEGTRIEFHEEDAKWRRVCLDGKIIRVEKGGWVEVHGPVEGVVDLIVRG